MPPPCWVLLGLVAAGSGTEQRQVAAAGWAGPYRSSAANFVAYSSRLPRNGSTGEGGVHWTKPCFTHGGNAFAAESIGWRALNSSCAVDDPPQYCFTDPAAVKACMDRMPPGRRAIHLEGSIWLYGKHSAKNRPQCGGWADWDDRLPGACTLWADAWQAIASRRFDRWFAEYKALGGTVDVIMIDFESNPWWEAGDFAHSLADLNHTLADPRWPAVLAQLNAAGQPFGVDFGNISDIVFWGSTHFDSDWRKWVWVDVMMARRGAYLNASLFEPVRRHFPAVKGAEYDHRKIAILSRSVALSVSLTQKASLCQTTTQVQALAGRRGSEASRTHPCAAARTSGRTAATPSTERQRCPMAHTPSCSGRGRRRQTAASKRQTSPRPLLHSTSC